jgi:hypothetical protein
MDGEWCASASRLDGQGHLSSPPVLHSWGFWTGIPSILFVTLPDLKEQLACLRQVCEETERLVEKADSTLERI